MAEVFGASKISSSSRRKSCEGAQKVGTYIIESTIGKGNFSFVKLARHTVTNVKVAIKIIDKTKLNEESLKKAQREADILKSLHHNNIIKLYQVMESKKLLCIVTEYLPNGELYEYIANNGYLTEQVARHKFMEILSAVEHCHLNNVVHRDLKAENMLLDERMSIKLADFGFGTFQPNGPDPLLTTWCGSPPYAAPEIFKGEPYLGVCADIWSLGVILYVLVCGVLPFDAQEVSRLRHQVLEEHIRVPYWLSMSCEDLLKRMLAKTPSRRPSINEIYNSKWLSEINDFGSVPHPLALDETDSCVSREHPFTFTSNLPHQSSSVIPPSSPTLAAEMKAGKLDQTVIQIMGNSGIDRGQLLESLERCAYDHLTATYLLLGESLRTNPHGLPQTLAKDNKNGIIMPNETRDRKLLQRQQEHHHYHDYHQHPHSCPSCHFSKTAAELSFQQFPPTWYHHEATGHRVACFGVKDSATPSITHDNVNKNNHGGGNPIAFISPNVDYMDDTPIHPSSHPREGFLFGLALSRLSEFAASGGGAVVGLRRTDASPSPPASPINLSSHNAEGGDCFGSDCFRYQWKGVASSPTRVLSVEAGLTPGQSNHSAYAMNPARTANAANPGSFCTAESAEVCTAALQHTNVSNPLTSYQTSSHEVSITYSALPNTVHPTITGTHTYSLHHRRYSSTSDPTYLLNLPSSILRCVCESRNFNDEHTCGFGSSMEAYSHPLSFSQPIVGTLDNASTAPLVTDHFDPMETSYNDDVGIDIPARTSRKHICVHASPKSTSALASSSASTAAAVALVIGYPWGKMGVNERQPALVDQFIRFQGLAQFDQLHQLGPRTHLPTQPYDGMDF